MSLGSVFREQEGKVGPLSHHRFYGDRAMVFFDDRADDREAETGSAETARARFVHCVETLEDVLLLEERNADTSVPDVDLDHLLLGFDLDCDLCGGFEYFAALSRRFLIASSKISGSA